MRNWWIAAGALGLLLAGAHGAAAADGTVLTTLENQVQAATTGWEATILSAAKSLFWILAGIEFGIAAVWLAIQAPALDTWFGEIVRRIMFVGFFAFVLNNGPDFAKSIVDSLFQIGAGGGSASPANIFNAGIKVASSMSKNAQFGLWEDNALAMAAIFAMVVVVICFSLVAAIFVAVLIEMYVGTLAGIIMLGGGGSSYTKDFAVRYLIYAFSVGMKLMALVMIARIGSDVLLGLSNASTSDDQFVSTLSIAGVSVVVFLVALYVPGIIQGVVQGASVGSGMEVLKASGQAGSFGMASAGVGVGMTRLGQGAAGAYQAARAAGASRAGAGAGAAKAAAGAVVGAVNDKLVGTSGSGLTSTLGLANEKLRSGKKG